MLDQTVISFKEIGGGGNSKVYKLTCKSSDQYAAKLYFHHNSDPRDRLGTELSSMNFLWDNGIRCIPRPITADRDRGFAVFEYICGEKILSEEVSDVDIDNITQFLKRLKDLKTKKGSEDLPIASDACFSVQAIVNSIERRFNRLSGFSKAGEEYNDLYDFLTKDLSPAFDEIKKWSKSRLNESGISFFSEIPQEERTLSPSDYGFHNALRQNDGKLMFLDFEYFGWDDPAKMTSDFLLHPAMRLPDSLKQRFVHNVITQFDDHRDLPKRFAIVYPLFGINWCLILLNEYVPQYFLRREFADRSKCNKANIQTEQLLKARQMLKKIETEYENFSSVY